MTMDGSADVTAGRGARARTDDHPRTSERLVFFTDAVVAIAMTLLILPLMDAVGDAAEEGLSAWGYVQANADPLLSFLLSFVIIARFWRAHHRLFDHLEFEPPGLSRLNTFWLLTIVFLPVATAMTGLLEPSDSVYAIYIGTMLLSALLMTAMTVLVRRHPEVWREDHEVPADSVVSAVSLTVLMAAALLLSLVLPVTGYWALLVLLLGRPVHLLLSGLLARLGRPAPSAAGSSAPGSSPAAPSAAGAPGSRGSESAADRATSPD